mgnify:FL=1
MAMELVQRYCAEPLGPAFAELFGAPLYWSGQVL